MQIQFGVQITFHEKEFVALIRLLTKTSTGEILDEKERQQARSLGEGMAVAKYNAECRGGGSVV